MFVRLFPPTLNQFVIYSWEATTSSVSWGLLNGDVGLLLSWVTRRTGRGLGGAGGEFSLPSTTWGTQTPNGQELKSVFYHSHVKPQFALRLRGRDEGFGGGRSAAPWPWPTR